MLVFVSVVRSAPWSASLTHSSTQSNQPNDGLIDDSFGDPVGSWVELGGSECIGSQSQQFTRWVCRTAEAEAASTNTKQQQQPQVQQKIKI